MKCERVVSDRLTCIVGENTISKGWHVDVSQGDPGTYTASSTVSVLWVHEQPTIDSW